MPVITYLKKRRQSKVWTQKPDGQKLHCPHCNAVVARIEGDHMYACDQEFWLHGGDSLSEAYEGLVTDGRLPPLNWDAGWFFGNCMHCRKRYFAVETTFRKKPETQEWWESRLAKGIEGPSKSWLIQCEHRCFIVPRSWVMTRYEMEDGSIDTHMFGPWRSGDGETAALMFQELKELLTKLAKADVQEGLVINQEVHV